MNKLLSAETYNKIWNAYASRGISSDRIAHVRKVVDNYFSLKAGHGDYFYSAMLPDNMAFEKRMGYLKQLEWLTARHDTLGISGQRSLEAGVALHDIGLTVSPGGDHPEIGYQLLQSPQLREELNIDSTDPDYRLMCDTVRYHGLFVDIGFLFSPRIITSFKEDAITALGVMTFLDSTAKPLGNGQFHNMSFSRMLDRIRQFTNEGRCSLTWQERLQQLFGPINYSWLEDCDAETAARAVKDEGLDERTGFKTIMEKMFISCWPLVKDIITPEISHSITYFTPMDKSYLPDLIGFLSLMSGILEQIKPAGNVYVEVDKNIDYFNFANRPAYLADLRKNLSAPLYRVGEDGFKFGNHAVKVEQLNGEQKIILTTIPLTGGKKI